MRLPRRPATTLLAAVAAGVLVLGGCSSQDTADVSPEGPLEETESGEHADPLGGEPDDAEVPVGTGSPDGAPAPAAGGPGDPLQSGVGPGGQLGDPPAGPGEELVPPGPENNTPGGEPDDVVEDDPVS